MRAALVLVARFGNGRPEGALGLAFEAIAIVVIGGASSRGGRRSLVRTVVGIAAAVLLDRWARSVEPMSDRRPRRRGPQYGRRPK